MIHAGGNTVAARVVEETTTVNNLLTRQEVVALVDAYRAGAGVVALAATFGINRQTVTRHLDREGVTKRSTVKMTPEITARARGLYESGMTVEEVGRELAIGPSTIWRGLRRAGTTMRAQAPRANTAHQPARNSPHSPSESDC